MSLQASFNPHQCLRYLITLYAGTPFCNDIRAYTSIYQLVEHVPELALSALLNPGTAFIETVLHLIHTLITSRSGA